MATLKESFTKGITAINVKTNNFMEESKCKTYISTLEAEIKELKLQAGEISYEKWCKLDVPGEEVHAIFEQIHKKYQEIEAQKIRIQQLSEEEKQILGTTGNTQQAENANVVYCSQCGAQNAANYKFCCKCGNPIK